MNDYVIQMRMFFSNVGYVLTLAPLLAKTWRVHKVLTESKKTLQKIVIRYPCSYLFEMYTLYNTLNSNILNINLI